MGTKTHAITDEEWPRYATALLNADGDFLIYAAVIAVILGTGARIGEVCPLRDCDLFKPDGSPRQEITRTLEKKRSSAPVRLTVYFPWKHIGQPIIKWRAEARKRFFVRPDDFLFSLRYSGQPVNRRTVYQKNRDLLSAIGIDPRGVGLHGIRKTFLRALYRERLRQGDDMMTALRHAQKAAGHSQFETTIHYLADEITGSHADTVENIFSTFPAR